MFISSCSLFRIHVRDTTEEKVFDIAIQITMNRSSHPEVFLGKGVLKKCSKFTGEHPCQSCKAMLLNEAR